jgi:hypothetical protein
VKLSADSKLNANLNVNSKLNAISKSKRKLNGKAKSIYWSSGEQIKAGDRTGRQNPACNKERSVYPVNLIYPVSRAGGRDASD